MRADTSFLLLGSGELAKEFIQVARDFGYTTIAVGRYPRAPAMQIADHWEVINMLDAAELDAVVEKYKPTYIVPEIEAIRVEQLYAYEKQGITVVPSAYAVNVTMDRRKTRDLATSLGLETAKYQYASDYTTLEIAAKSIGFPCVIKPLMSSSGKGQSIARNESELQLAWDNSISGSRGDVKEVIVEEFIEFENEITLLTVTHDATPVATDTEDTENAMGVYFCDPIGHTQKNGDYQTSWQPFMECSPIQLAKARIMAKSVVTALGGHGLWGVEFFVLKDDKILFSELSPRPHDTGLVTLKSQHFSQFLLHLMAIIGEKVPNTSSNTRRSAATHVIKSVFTSTNFRSLPDYTFEIGNEVRNSEWTNAVPRKIIFDNQRVNFNIFNKPSAYRGRRMGVVIAYNKYGDSGDLVSREKDLVNLKRVAEIYANSVHAK
jgi:phosphoribosylglycinamide formyltransferase 2